MDRTLLAQIGHVLRPLSTRVANLVARGVVQLVNDGKKLQLVQLGVLAGQTVEGRSGGAEHFQAYGFTSVPLGGAEGVVIFPNGDGEHPLLIAVSDRRYRPTGKQPGEVTMYNNAGASITMTKDGDIIGTPAPGRDFYVKSAGGVAERVVKVSEFNGHTHAAGTLTAPSGGGTCTGASGGAADVSGTQTFQAE